MFPPNLSRRGFLGVLGACITLPIRRAYAVETPVVGAINRVTCTFWRNQLTFKGAPFVFDRTCPGTKVYVVNRRSGTYVSA